MSQAFLPPPPPSPKLLSDMARLRTPEAPFILHTSGSPLQPSTLSGGRGGATSVSISVCGVHCFFCKHRSVGTAWRPPPAPVAKTRRTTTSAAAAAAAATTTTTTTTTNDADDHNTQTQKQQQPQHQPQHQQQHLSCLKQAVGAPEWLSQIRGRLSCACESFKWHLSGPGRQKQTTKGKPRQQQNNNQATTSPQQTPTPNKRTSQSGAAQHVKRVGADSA